MGKLGHQWQQKMGDQLPVSTLAPAQLQRLAADQNGLVRGCV